MTRRTSSITTTVTTMIGTVLCRLPCGPALVARFDRHDRHQADRKATRRRPDRQRVQRAAVGDGIADDLRVTPNAKLDRDEHSRGDTGSRGIQAPKRNRRC